MAVAIVVAAGSGERLGAPVPKACVPVGGRPMLEWSLAALAAVPAVSSIVVALPPGVEVALPAGVVGVVGGLTRSESVLAALEAAADGDPILVHDAARPLADAELFAGALAAFADQDVDALIAAVVSTNTLKRVDADNQVVETLDRSQVWAVQTPQVFRRAVLQAALGGASAAELAGATDDAALVERRGGRVGVWPSDEWNIKVTWPRDLQVAELLLSQR